MTEPADRSRVDSAADLVIQVTPEPTEEERDALLAALAILIAEPVAAISAAQVRATPSRWARAGREEAFEARRGSRRWRGG